MCLRIDQGWFSPRRADPADPSHALASRPRRLSGEVAGGGEQVSLPARRRVQETRAIADRSTSAIPHPISNRGDCVLGLVCFSGPELAVV
jgi:hypothetical protein